MHYQLPQYAGLLLVWWLRQVAFALCCSCTAVYNTQSSAAHQSAQGVAASTWLGVAYTGRRTRRTGQAVCMNNRLCCNTVVEGCHAAGAPAVHDAA
jgi:hypothetical protein